MAKKSELPGKYRPERPVYLNEQNTGFKTKDEVLYAIERLRDLYQFLCTYAEKTRPFHLSFDKEQEFHEFKRACRELGVELKSPVLKEEDLLGLALQDDPQREFLQEANAKSSYEDVDGKVHIEVP